MSKMTKYALSFAVIFIGSASAGRPDFIRDAIEKGKLDIINTCIQTDYPISLKDKQIYSNLAHEMIEKKKAQVKKANVLASIDNVSLTIGALTVAFLTSEAISMFKSQDDKAWKGYAAFGLALCKLADSSIKVMKDVMKEEKNANEDIENAEKVAAAVDRL
jgi:hypothetical protein